MSDLKLYIWENVLTDSESGLIESSIIAIARDIEEAIGDIEQRYGCLAATECHINYYRQFYATSTISAIIR